MDIVFDADSQIEAFAGQLRRTLQILKTDDDLMSMRGVDLGLDSLISVDLRVEVSIPVLKIMANDVQMATLAEMVVEDVPAALIPWMSEHRSVATGRDDTSKVNTATTSSSADLPPATSIASNPEGKSGRSTNWSVGVCLVDFHSNTFYPQM